MFYPDSLTRVAHSRIHHFADTGLWVCGATGQGGVIHSSLVTREGIEDNYIGRVGVYLDRADEINLLYSMIDLSQYYGGDGVGVEVYYGKTYCESSGPGSESLLIDSTYVKGPGMVGAADDVGMRFHWVCGGLDRDVDVWSNYVYQWDFAGMELQQDSDIQMTCNIITECPRSVHISRDQTPTGPGVRFKNNELRTFEDEGAVLRTDNSLKTKLGPAWGDRGSNRFRKKQDDAPCFIFEDDPNSQIVLNAEQNYWLETLDGQNYNWLSDVERIRYFVRATGGDSGDATASVDNPLTGDPPDLFCHPKPPGGGGSGTTQTRKQAESPESTGGLGERAATGVREVTKSIPLVSYLGPAMPNPARDRVVFELGIGAKQGGRCIADVYDVQGRRVQRLVDRLLEPGVYTVTWGGRDEGGLLASPGIYFVRVTGAGYCESKKVILLR